MLTLDLSFLIILFCIYECVLIMVKDFIKPKKETASYHWGFTVLGSYIIIMTLLYFPSMFLLLFTNKWYIGFSMLVIDTIAYVVVKKFNKSNDSNMILVQFVRIAILITYFV